MPSASSKSQAVAAQTGVVDVLQEPVKSAVSVADKKLRNLEKRKLKLLETKKKAEKGEQLNADQKNALKSLESLDFSLETVKDVQKNLVSLELEYAKLAKKEAKRLKLEQRDQAEGRSQQVVFGVIEIQAILGEMSEDVRPDFLAGNNGACQLTETDLDNLDSVYELINPASSDDKSTKLSERVKTAGKHLMGLVEGKASTAFESTTYKDINELLQKIKGCGYFDKEQTNGQTVTEEVPEAPVVEEEQKPEEPVEAPQSESPKEESPVEKAVETGPVPVNGVDLPPVVQETPEEEGFKFMGESELSAAVQEGSLNPVSPEFVPRKMQSQGDEGFDNGSDGNDAQWQVEGGNNQGGGYRGRGGRGGRGGNFRGSRGGRGNYRGGQRDGSFRGSRGGNRGSGGNYRGNREGGSRGNYRGGPRDGTRGGGRGGRGGQTQQQPQQ